MKYVILEIKHSKKYWTAKKLSHFNIVLNITLGALCDQAKKNKESLSEHLKGSSKP